MYCGIFIYHDVGDSSVMYRSLRTNLPKEIMAFHPQHLIGPSVGMNNSSSSSSCSETSFVTHEDIQDYLTRYVAARKLMRCIRLNHRVVQISKRRDTTTKGVDDGTSSEASVDDYSDSQWEVAYTTADPDIPAVEHFDAVIVCNGHYSHPFQPNVPGMQEHYHKETYHSRDYDRIKYTLLGRRVLVVGSKSSGTDMARELTQIARHVFVSDRNYKHEIGDSSSADRDDGGTRGSNLELLPGISHFEPPVDDESVIVFTDGQQLRGVDVILWCTGFLYEFPFIDAQIDSTLRAPIIVEGGKRVRPLHLQLLCIEDPSLAFIGLPFSVVPFPLFYCQALFVAAVYSGQTTLPSQHEQYALLVEREASLRARGLVDGKYHYLGDEQFQYIRLLARSSGHLLPEADGGVHGSSGPILEEDGDKSYGSGGVGDKEEEEERHSRWGRYIDLLEAIYGDNGLHKPRYVGAPDTYRDRRYRVNW